jgi:hypothetical protein
MFDRNTKMLATTAKLAAMPRQIGCTLIDVKMITAVEEPPCIVRKPMRDLTYACESRRRRPGTNAPAVEAAVPAQEVHCRPSTPTYT